MTRSRRLLYQASLVTALGAVSMFRAPKVEAAASDCQGVYCFEGCGYADLAMCLGCGGGVSTQCEYSSGCVTQTDGQGPWVVFCGYAS